jgi:hypothetical protein
MERNPSLFGLLIRPVKSGQNPTYSRILRFHTTDSNKHILSLKYQNHAIQKSKIIYTSRNTIFMKDVKSDKIFLKATIHT